MKGHTCEKGGMEPPPVLVRAFKVQVCRPGKSWSSLEDRFMADPRIEPDIEDIPFEFKVLAVATRTGDPFFDFSGLFWIKPEIDPFLPGPGNEPFHEIVVEEAFSAIGTSERRDRDTPGSLS